MANPSARRNRTIGIRIGPKVTALGIPSTTFSGDGQVGHRELRGSRNIAGTSPPEASAFARAFAHRCVNPTHIQWLASAV